MPGINAEAAVSAVRAAHRDVRLLGFTPTPIDRRLDGCEVVTSPVDWKDLRGLLTERVTRSPSAPAATAPAPLPTNPPITEAPTPAPTAESPLDTGIASTFLRDEAHSIEHVNWFDAALPDLGTRISGRILRVSPNFVVCEVLHPLQMLTPGCVSNEAVVQLARNEAYRGPARLSKVVNTGRSLICEWALQGRWQSLPATSSASVMPEKQALAPFFERMALIGRISAVFKAAVADVAGALEEARQCLERIELALPLVRGQTTEETRRAVLPELQKNLFPALDAVFSRFEEASSQIPPDLDAEYHSIVRQHLHPLMMCAPFIHHVYAKPLGFAGDYRALQKLIEPPFDGPTLYASLLNAWLVLSPAGTAYRHRLALLEQEFDAQAQRCHDEGHDLRVLSIGCGAANEVARFVVNNDLCNSAEITLADFNPETIAFARSQVTQAQQQHWRLARISYVTTSIQALVADEARMRRRGLAALGPVARMAGYDFIYCAGLFDYFSDRVCQRLLAMMYQMLAPGGRIVVCNFTPANPIRAFMKYVLDWTLIYRTQDEIARLAPPDAQVSLSLSPGGVEVYLRLNRPRI
jgi:extracellular factor (EF) 3-hydroxypalmitic acid methyl ester biosynthesis protein